MAVKFTNNAKTTLASSLTNVATSASVVDGSVFPTLGAGEYFYCTFDDGSNNEIVKVTARSGNTLTIVRGVDNTTARAFSSGDAAELRATAGLLTDIQENIAAKSANQTVYNTTTASSATSYDIGIDPSVEANAMVFLNGVMQHHDTFSFSGSTLTFDTAPADGMALEVIVDNLVNLQSSNLTVDTFTAADVGGNPQTDFTLSDSPAAETNLIVFVDGVFQAQDAYTISTNVLTMTDGVIADRVVTVYVINPVNIGTPSDGTVTSAKLSGNITMPANLTVTGDVAFDSPTFVVDNANSRVGIGTASPSTLLDIVGDVKMSADLTVDTNTLYVDSADDRVGIGTTNPGTKLDISVVGGMARVGGAAGNNLFQTYTGSVGAGIWAGGQTRLYSTGSMTLSTGATLTTTAPTGYTDAVTIDASGNVGIGTTNTIANSILNVEGGINTTTGIVGILTSDSFTFNGLTNPHYGINFNPTGTRPIGISGYSGIAFATSGIERMRMHPNGYVSIGGSGGVFNGTPENALSLVHDGHGLGFDYVSSLPRTAGLYTSSSALTETAYGDLNIKARSDYGGFYGIGFFTASSDNTPALRMKITSAGDVTLPTGSLTTTSGIITAGHMIRSDAGHNTARIEAIYDDQNNDSTNGNILMWVSEPGITYDSGGIGVNIHPEGQYYGRKYNNGYGVYMRFEKQTGHTVFYNTQGTSGSTGGQGTETFRIKQSGSVSIGAGNSIAFSSGEKASIINSAASGQGLGIRTVTATAQCLGLWNSDNGGTRTFINFAVSSGGGGVGSITSTGSTTAYNTTSDYRLKENVVELENAIDRVKLLQPRRFNFIADADTTVDGFLAHEVSDIVPEAVTGVKDEMQEEEYEVTPEILDEYGVVTTQAVMGTREVPKYQGIDQSKLIPLLTKAIQEQQTIIEDLKARIETLENA